MEKKQNSHRNPETSSQKTKKFGTSGLQISEDDASHLVGSIVEKGISDEPRTKPFLPTPPPNPTLLPFPVARHRSHGPHWAPVGGKVNGGYGDHGDDNEDGGLSDEEDKTTIDFDPIAPFANPVKRKTKTDMDFSKWREILPGEKSVMAEKPKRNVLRSGKTENRERAKETIDIADKSEDKSGKASSVTEMELDYSNKVHVKDDYKDSIPVGFENEREPICVNSQIDDKKMGHYDAALTERLTRREQNCSTSSKVSSGSNVSNEQEPTSLESQIDAENRERLSGMSPDEIAQAQAEIMEKMDPALLRLLKKRGEVKLKKQKSSSPDIANNVELGNGQKNGDKKDTKALAVSESAVVHMATKATSKEIQCEVDNVEKRNPNTASSGLWSAWSQRVESVRELRFSLEGTVIESDHVQIAETDRVTKRDFLRTEGDPGATGYTIKEAVALTRSVIPGQRALALHLLLAVLDNAIHNINQGQVGCYMKNEHKVDRFSEWEAIWAYALGPEPELVLSLRMCLDDNHTSVVLACAKVIQRILTCDANENFFNFSEKLTTFKDICTAPVFRSKPEIDVGFLHGGFWKYNAKPSNIVPLNEDIIDDETEGKQTIQDDIVVAGQDFAAGLVRMGILPRLRYLLESDPKAALDECVISILIAIARHSPACANAIMNCQRLVETVVHRFTSKDVEIYPSKIKSVTLLEVLARSDRRICFEFIKNGVFQTMTWNLYQYTSTLDRWVKTGQENCKLSSSLLVEQLRFWKVCIQHGYCVSYFSDIFPSLCLWLNPPTLEKLIDKNVLGEFASISAEAYLVLKALATRLPNFVSQMHQTNQIQEHAGDDTEIWRWSHVGPMVDLAVKWIVLMGDLNSGSHALHDSCFTSLLWVCSAVMSMLAEVLKRMVPDDTVSQTGSGWLVPWLPEFVPRVGLEIIKNRFLSFSNASDTKFGTGLAGDHSFVERLCHLRQQNEYETSLASVCCLHGIFQTITTIDNLIQLVDKGVQSSQDYSLSREEEILKDGIFYRFFVELKSVRDIFMKLVTSEWQFVQSIEMFGRGGPAPGVGLGWGASGGGYWSATVLLAQADAGLIIDLLETFQIMSVNDIPRDEEIPFAAVEIINSSLAASLIAGPRDRTVVDKAFKVLVHVSVLKCLDRCIRHFHLTSVVKPFDWEYKEEDYLVFSKILTSHFGNRWLSVKKKSKTIDSLSCSTNKNSSKSNRSLDTIYEDLDTSNSVQDCESLVVEWAHQRLPLPINWFLSPISTLCNIKHAGLRKSSNLENLMQDPGDLFEVAKGGLFFLLGMEAMSSFLPSGAPSPVQSVPLVWKLHCLSVILLVGMGLIDEDKSRDVYEALQDLYGAVLDKERLRSAEMAWDKNVNPLSETRNNNILEFLRFQSEVHDSYSTFIETLVEQFSAISYGDLIYGRQVAIYLHRCVEAPVRLAAWNALINARVLELLPPLESCFGEAEGYLQPKEENDAILEAYVKSWTSGALDRAASRGTVAYTLVIHHLSSFIFHSSTGDKLLLRNKLVRSLLRDFSLKPLHEVIMLNLIRYTEPATSLLSNVKVGLPLESGIEERFDILTEACERNSSLLSEVKKLKSLVQNGSS